MASADNRAMRFVVHGRVQGVGFRVASVRMARRCGLSGWVRNRANGAVEAVAEGRASDLARFSRWLKTGPPGARVIGVDAHEIPACGVYSGFRIEY